MKARFLIVTTLLFACGGSSTPDSPDAPPAPTPDASPPDAGLEACDMEGATRAGACGNCGMRSERCEGGFWTPQGPCLDEGECAPGSTETGTLPLCGEQQRLCDNLCAWGDWNVTVPGTGECEPASTQLAQADCPAGQFRHQTCSDTCAWVTQANPCVDMCGAAPRATLSLDEEDACIPAGPFVRGEMGYPSTEPVATVMLSAYYIDRYAVTNRRYAACVGAGVCTLPVDPTGAAAVSDPMKTEYVVLKVTWDQAVTFCNWDGGRRLPTEAEWEKAGRGPDPRTNPYTWDGTTWRCDLVVKSGCPGWSWDYSDPQWTEPYDAHPGDRSYYDVYGLLSSGPEWTHDWYSATYYSLPESLIDPQGPATGTEHTLRSEYRWQGGMGSPTVSERHLPDEGSIRCARSAPGL
jgi:formylglycine-generating enzyme